MVFFQFIGRREDQLICGPGLKKPGRLMKKALFTLALAFSATASFAQATISAA
jgi:hypothetical protein